ncbi:MAG TPA: AI-2E family transporter [Caulobacteraceae bacterium]|nr:AI-2E family transporter [Caulobacteraceae bacterium]
MRLFRGRDGRPPLTSLSGLSAVRAAVIFLAIVVAGVLVKIFQEIVSPLVVATFLLVLIGALAQDLDSRFPKVPRLLRGILAGSVIIAAFSAITLLIVFEGPPFTGQMMGIEPHVNVLLTQVTAMAGQQPLTVREIFRGADPTQIFTQVFATARGAITYAALVMIYLGFLLASRQEFSAKMDRLYDTEHHREQARRVFSSIANAVEQYVRLVTFKALLIAVVAFGVMAAFGIHAALFVSFLIFLSAFVPIVGAFAGAMIPALVALAQFGNLTTPLIIVVLLGGGVFVIDNILMPKLQGDELNIDPLLVLISIGFWGLMLGPPGALLSTPLTVTLMAIAAEFDGLKWLAILISKDGQPIKEVRSG